MATIDTIESFAPIVDARCRLLVLGSMPGKRSLEAGEYYAYRHNAFWRIMGELVGASPELPYTRRVSILLDHGIAVWDVLASCRRTGSLDSNIERDSIRTNPFREFFRGYPGIERVYFNGAKAEHTFMRRVAPLLSGDLARLKLRRLPSTSPAHAGMRPADKIEKWRAILEQ